MKLAICHYSFHRRWAEEKWTLLRLCEEVKSLGVDSVDFHARLIGNLGDPVQEIQSALSKTGVNISGLSLSTDFNIEDPGEYQEMIDNTIKWMQVAAEVNAPVSRIFGGTLKDRLKVDEDTKKKAFQRVTDALGVLSKEAENLGLVLALENHGGLPCTAEEQMAIIESVGSKYLQATIDIGNYLQCGQEATEGIQLASKYCAYVHIKDFKKEPTSTTPWGWTVSPCAVGEGDVDLLGCLSVLKEAGYKGYLALEYEGQEDEKTGVPKSLENIRKAMDRL
ncbi:MAG TPA: sugar phosphate isomerase/epimerase family protein [Candidatus Atribacteria bacterium]|nr:sugar phosphate isomerase/epimerase family protein [Candidatus Atribacteria bacterium]